MMLVATFLCLPIAINALTTFGRISTSSASNPCAGTATSYRNMFYNYHFDPQICTFENIVDAETYYSKSYTYPSIFKLTNTKITMFTADLMKPFNRTKGVIFENCETETIEDGAFKNLTLYTTVGFNRNKLQRIGKDTFGSMVNLTSLNLSSNAISTIEDGAFAQMPNLVKLDLSQNVIVIIKEDMFDNLENLLALNLQQNKIQNINKAAFGHLNKLNKLNLSNNAISSLDSKTFIGLTALTILDISNNQLTTLNPVIFIHVPRLYKIILSNNYLDNINIGDIVAQTRVGSIDFHTNLLSCDSLFNLIKECGALRVNIEHGPVKDDLNIYGNTCPGMDEYFDTMHEKITPSEDPAVTRLKVISSNIGTMVGLLVSILIINIGLAIFYVLKNLNVSEALLRLRSHDNTCEMQRMV